MTQQPVLSDEQIEEIVHIVLNHGQIDAAVAEIREYLAVLATSVAPAGDREAVALDAFDVGELNTYGGGNVGWWLDYIRSLLGDAHQSYQEQVSAAPPAQPAEERAVVGALRKAPSYQMYGADGREILAFCFTNLDDLEAAAKAWAALDRARAGSEVKS